MDIRELLALEASSASIKKIDQFLTKKSPNDRDYPKALAHLAYLTFQLGDVSSSFQLLFSYLEICIDKEKPTILDSKDAMKRASAEYNIAVACYMLGDLELASEWLDRSDAENKLPVLSDGLRKRIEARQR